MQPILFCEMENIETSKVSNSLLCFIFCEAKILALCSVTLLHIEFQIKTELIHQNEECIEQQTTSDLVQPIILELINNVSTTSKSLTYYKCPLHFELCTCHRCLKKITKSTQKTPQWNCHIIMAMEKY